MLKIGDFSRLGRISVKALRYYDEIGLLKPVTVDHCSSIIICYLLTLNGAERDGGNRSDSDCGEAG